jgi:ATP-dependent Clp protease protease subunit
MIHQVLGGYQGQGSDLEIHAKETLRVKSMLNQIMAKHTHKTEKQLEKDTERDNFLTAEAALKYGLVDKVFSHRHVSTEKATKK